jgi:hypothetical protein
VENDIEGRCAGYTAVLTKQFLEIEIIYVASFCHYFSIFFLKNEFSYIPMLSELKNVVGRCL